MRVDRVLVLIVLLLALPGAAEAGQNPAPGSAQTDDADRDPNVSQPDFTLVNLPTSLKEPQLPFGTRRSKWRCPPFIEPDPPRNWPACTWAPVKTFGSMLDRWP